MQPLRKRQILLWCFSFIMIVAGTWFSGPAFAQPENALEVFRNAYENRYTWDRNFPGYTATVEINQDGQQFQGRIQVNRDFSTKVTGIEDKKVEKSVADQLAMMITHRRNVPFDLSHGKHSFTVGETTPSGAFKIEQFGEGTPSSYEVKSQKITQVNRLMGAVAVKVDLLEQENTPKGYLGTHYIATFTYVQTGDLLETVDFQDTYEKVGNYYIPSRQIIRTLEPGQKSTMDIKLSNIQLLPASVG
jgi:hypothetical protein